MTPWEAESFNRPIFIVEIEHVTKEPLCKQSTRSRCFLRSNQWQLLHPVVFHLRPLAGRPGHQPAFLQPRSCAHSTPQPFHQPKIGRRMDASPALIWISTIRLKFNFSTSWHSFSWRLSSVSSLLVPAINRSAFSDLHFLASVLILPLTLPFHFPA